MLFQEVEAVHKERIKKSGQILEQHVLLNRTRLSCRMEFLQDDINKRKEKKLEMFRHNKERGNISTAYCSWIDSLNNYCTLLT